MIVFDWSISLDSNIWKKENDIIYTETIKYLSSLRLSTVPWGIYRRIKSHCLGSGFSVIHSRDLVVFFHFSFLLYGCLLSPQGPVEEIWKPSLTSLLVQLIMIDILKNSTSWQVKGTVRFKGVWWWISRIARKRPLNPARSGISIFSNWAIVKTLIKNDFALVFKFLFTRSLIQQLFIYLFIYLFV